MLQQVKARQQTRKSSRQVRPKTKDLRKRIGQVYEDAGMSLDLDRVSEMGNSTMAEEVLSPVGLQRKKKQT